MRNRREWRRRFFGGSQKDILCAEADKVTAAFSGFDIAFFAKKGIGMFRCDRADAGFGGNEALGRKFGSIRINTLDDILSDLSIELKLGRYIFVFLNKVIYLVL